MSAPTHDPLLEEIRSRAVQLHLRVVVAFQRQHIHAARAVQQRPGHAAKIGGISNPAAESFDYKSMRAHIIMCKAQGPELNSRERLKWMPIERADLNIRPSLAGAGVQFIL